jgi:hypothetical protein
MQLAELTSLIRSNNAGPFSLTFEGEGSNMGGCLLR